MSTKNEDKVKELSNYFNIGIKPSAKKPEDQLFPTKRIRKDNEEDKYVKEKFPTHIEYLYQQYLHQTYIKQDKWNDRKELNDDMYEMYINNPTISYAVQLILTNVLGNLETKNNPISIEAKRPLKKVIKKLFDDIGINKELRSMVLNIILFGNDGGVIDLDSQGIESFTPVKVDEIKERLEFNASEVEKELKNNQYSYVSQLSNLKRSELMINSIKDKADASSFHKTYLLGFLVGDILLPPWRFIHFRYKMGLSPFRPFGTPYYIHALAATKQYQYAMTLQGIARSTRFPTDVYEVFISDKQNPTDKLMAVINFMRELQNSGMGRVKKEQNGIGKTIFTVKDLYEWRQEVPELDLGKIDDIEMLRDDVLIATHVPRDLIDPTDSGFGESGVAYKEKFRPFGNTIYDIQSVLLEGLTLLVKIHLIQGGHVKDIESAEFSLGLPFPSVLQNDDVINQKSDLLSLSNDVMDSFSDRFLDGGTVPPEIALDIYKYFLPFDDITVDTWYKDIQKQKDLGNIEGEGEGDKEDKVEDEEIKESRKLIEQHIGKKKRRIKEAVEDAVVEFKIENLREGIIQNSHYYTSSNKEDFDPGLLLDYRVQMATDEYKNKLNEQEKKQINEIEEVKYVFKSNDKEELDE